MTRLFVILFCCYPFLLLLASQEEIQKNQIEDDEEEIEHMKETQGVRWFASEAEQSNETENERYARTQSFAVQASYKTVSDEEKKKVMQDSNVVVARDYQACKFAVKKLRQQLGLSLISENIKIRKRAEEWAIYLSSRLSLKEKEKIFFDDSSKDMGQLIYYAEELEQPPGCNMAITAWMMCVIYKFDVFIVTKIYL